MIAEPVVAAASVSYTIARQVVVRDVGSRTELGG